MFWFIFKNWKYLCGEGSENKIEKSSLLIKLLWKIKQLLILISEYFIIIFTYFSHIYLHGIFMDHHITKYINTYIKV